MFKIEKTSIEVKQTIMQSITFRKFKEKNLMYAVLAEGNCGTFIVIDIDESKVIKEFDLPGSTGSWIVAVADDEQVYIGTYVNGGIYRYDPFLDKVETVISNVPGAKFVFDLAFDEEGCLYAGTWPNCAIAKINVDRNEIEYIEEKVIPTEDYVRSLVYSKYNKKLYAGVMSHAHLAEHDPVTKKSLNFLPAEYMKESFCRVVGTYEDTLAVYMNTSKTLLFFNTDTKEVIKKIVLQDSTKEKRPMNISMDHFITIGDQGRLLFIDLKKMDAYWIKSRENQILINGYKYDNKTIICSGFDGEIFFYDTKKDEIKRKDIVIPRKNIEIRQLHKTKDNHIYASGYLRGGIYVYDPKTNTGVQYDGVGQSEGITSFDKKVYFGKYPGAYIYEYDPSKKWDMITNPKTLCELKSEHKQDRPFALTGYDNKLYIGTIPDYGIVQGTLAIYDTKTNDYEVRTDFSKNRSIVSLTIKDGILYGGTTVCGGLGSHEMQKSGTVFAFDTKTKEYIYEVVPVEGKKNAGGLLITEDNKILGCADSCFFILDAKTGKKEYEKHVTEFNRVKDYKWEVTFIKKGPNRLYYMVIANRLFSYNHETKEIKSIYDKLVNLLEFDDTGRIYFQHEDSVREVYRSILPVE